MRSATVLWKWATARPTTGKAERSRDNNRKAGGLPPPAFVCGKENMLHADHTALQILGHTMIAFLFLYRCFTAMPRFAEHAGRLAKKHVPFPDLSLAIGFGMMLVGGASILFDFYSPIGACLLIVFTMLANVLYHDFWNHHDDLAERNRALYVFCNNTAVMGGLVLVATL